MTDELDTAAATGSETRVSLAADGTPAIAQPNADAPQGADGPEFKWRKVFDIHPVAEWPPEATLAQRVELGNEIKKHGQQAPVSFWIDATREQYRTMKNARLQMIDGRSRLDGMELVGLPVITPQGGLSPSVKSHIFFNDVDPYIIAAQLNLHRRHLTPEQKRDYIAKLLEAKPRLSDRTIAKIAKVAPPTVARVRNKLAKQATTETTLQLDKRIGADGKLRPAHPKKRGERTARPSASEPATPTADASSAGDGPAPQQSAEASEQTGLKERFHAFADLVTWLVTDNHPGVDELDRLARDDESLKLRHQLARDLPTAHERLRTWIDDKRFSSMVDEFVLSQERTTP